MTDAERAHRIVEDFRADGHPYYDELLAPIEFALAAVRADERRAIVAWLRQDGNARRLGENARFGGVFGALAVEEASDCIERGEHGVPV